MSDHTILVILFVYFMFRELLGWASYMFGDNDDE